MMDARERICEWINEGKQVGARAYVDVSGRSLYVSVGVQRYQERVRVAVREIEEQYMAGEEYERDEIFDFDDVDAAAVYVDTCTHVRFASLAPVRGNRVFDPEG